MVSIRLIQRIEQNWKQIAQSVIDQIHREPRVAHYHKLPDREIVDRADHLVRNLGRWLTGETAEATRIYESLGARRHSEGVPLEEIVYKLQMIKRKLREYIRDTSLPETSVDLYGELELIRAIDGFFDEVVYSVVRGYQAAQRKAAAAAA
ncbi:MAG: hypothetical protein ACK5AZ_19100 [Bryobacteraceae bacterium]